ncbi:MAG TPA: hypothetical protein VNK26_00310 [Pyrinomonadaceae bacterium]|nr:hypothetical protein [Pyrinomonadaceae bacterium]
MQKLHFGILLRLSVFTFLIFGLSQFVLGQAADTVIGQITSSGSESFAGSISGDGRFVVFESSGNIATENPRNEDGNTEIFLFDFAQRRIFQITNTKRVLKNQSGTQSQDNILVDVVNKRPVISSNGRWIAFASNATVARPSAPDPSNPGNFDGNAYSSQAPLPCTLPSPSPTPTATPTPTPSPSPSPSTSPTPTPTPFNNPMSCDANMEIWLYEIPPYSPAGLTSGDEIPYTELAGGNFELVTNTDPSRFPQPGTTLRGPFVADDNHDISINDDASRIAFVSTRDLVPGGNTFPSNDNDEIFTFTRTTSPLAPINSSTSVLTSNGIISQITQTPRGTIANPIYNSNPSINGPGDRVVFSSTGDNPIIGMTGGNNPSTSRNEEIFFSDLDVNGAPAGIKRQVTITTPTNAGDPVNLFAYGKRISRNGRYIVFDSFADLANENSGTNYTSFATYLYDSQSNSFRRIGPRSNADSQALGGDVARYPTFTDYDSFGEPATLLLETRLNIKPDGTIPSTASDGLNPDESRPVQIYSYPLNVAPSAATFTRLTKFPISSGFLAQTQPLASDSSSRLAFNLALTELGGGNADLSPEIYYLYVPPVTAPATTATLNFLTGATQLPVTPTTSASPSPTPTPTPTPSPSPTPTTPASVYGLSPGMLAVLNFSSGATPKTAVGSLKRSFQLPITLSGVSMTIGGFACGLQSVDSSSITFVVPPGLTPAVSGTIYPVVINSQGVVTKGFVTLVPARPDIFSSTGGAGGRAEAENVTNRVITREPFLVTTLQIRGGRKVPSIIRLKLTGVANFDNTSFNIKIGGTVVAGTSVLTGSTLVSPGVYTVDFRLPESLKGAGDVPIVVTIVIGSSTFTSRLEDTAPRIRIL